MKKRVISLLTVLALLLFSLPVLSTSAHAELIAGTFIRVLPSEGTDHSTFQVMYGPASLYQQGKLNDESEEALDGLQYIGPGKAAETFNLYLVAADKYKITSVKITEGFVENYVNGQMNFRSDVLNISDQNVVVLTGDQLNYRDGKNKSYISAGGSRISTIPQNYTGTAYFGDMETDSGGKRWIFELTVTTELQDSGAITIEETKFGTAQAIYSLDYGTGTLQGTAAKLTAGFKDAISKSKIKIGASITIKYDPKYIGGILVQNEFGDYVDPEEPEWTTEGNSISFIADRTNRTIRFIYNAPAGTVRFQTGDDPFAFTTEIDMTYGSKHFSGSMSEVNTKIADLIRSGEILPGDSLYFMLSDAQNIRAVRIAEAAVNPFTGREGDPGQFGDNVLQGRAFSVTLSNEKAYVIRVDFRSTLGRMYIQETKQDEGTFRLEVYTEGLHLIYFEGTAQETMKYLDSAISSRDAKVGSTITLRFPEDIEEVKMGVGEAQSTDITAQLADRKISYTETVDDVTFFVRYKDSGSEIIINPVQPLKPDETVPVPTISIEPFGPMPTPGSGNEVQQADAPWTYNHTFGPSKKTGDLTGLDYERKDGEEFDDSFDINIYGITEFSNEVFDSIAEYLNEGGNIIDFFSASVSVGINQDIRFGTNPEAVFANEFMPFNVRNYNRDYGDVTVTFTFPTVYQAGQTVISLVGVAANSDITWYPYSCSVSEDGSVEVTFPKDDMEAFSNRDAVLLVLSA